MKAKYLIMASLILAVFTISAVCASQDIIKDNNLTATDEAEDSLSESPVKEIVSTEENNQILEAEPTDFKVNITEEINISQENWENQTLASVYCSEDAEGVSVLMTSTGESQEVAEGYGRTTIDDLDVGNYLASASFDGNVYFNPSTDDTESGAEDFIITIADEINLDDENIENIPIVTIYCPNNAEEDDIYFFIKYGTAYPDFLKISLKENLGKTVNVTILNSNQGLKYIGCGNFTIRALVDQTDEIGSGPINITRTVSPDNFEFVTYTESNYGWVIDFRTTPLNGNLTVLVNGAERYNEYLEKYGPCPTLKSQDLGIDTPGEENEISVKFISEDGVTYDLAKFNYFQCSEHILIRDIDNYNNNLEIVKIMDSPVKGNVTVLFDGKTIYNDYLYSYGDVKHSAL